MAGRLELWDDRRIGRSSDLDATLGWPRAVIFDLDGTLIDSAPDIASSLNEVLGRRGLPPFPLEQVKAMVGGGIPTLIRRALEAHGVEPHDTEPLVRDMITVYAGRATVLTVLYDGAEAELARLRAAGIRIAICTNKSQEITDIILRDLGIAHYFASVAGIRPGGPRKPDPAALHAVLDALGLRAADAVMIGDSRADAGAAKAAGMPVVLVSFGYGTGPLAELEPDAVIDSLGALQAALAGLARRTRTAG
jgi:phosphoglycolate phosphatase